MKVSIDTGKKNSKVSFHLEGQLQHLVYLSNISLNATRINTTPESTIIHYNDRRYLVGEDGMNSFLENRSEMDKTNDVHRLLVLTGICKALKLAGQTDECVDIEMAINVPLAFYKSAGEQDRIIKFYQNNHQPYVVTMEDQRYTFKIKNVLPYFEGIGPLLSGTGNYDNQEVIGLDLGSLNTGYATFDNLRPIGSLSNNFNDGVDNLLAIVSDLLLTYNLPNLSEKNIQDIIKGTYKGNLPESVQEQVDQVCLDHLQQLQYTLFNRKLNLKLPFLVCGGGAILLERFLPMVFTNVQTCPNSLFANADAGLTLLN